VRRVRSLSGIGLSVVTIEFEGATELMRARQVVAERLQLSRTSLPADLPPPAMAPAASIMGEILFIALTSERAGGMELKSVADWTVRRRLLAVPGVAEVIAIGGDEKQYQVTLRPERLAAYNVTVEDVLKAVRGELFEVARSALSYRSVRAERDAPALEAMKRLADKTPVAEVAKKHKISEQTLVAEAAVEALVQAVLPWLARIDQRRLYASRLEPLENRFADEFRAVVGSQIANRTRTHQRAFSTRAGRSTSFRRSAACGVPSRSESRWSQSVTASRCS
jgi:hypothetical protein